MRSTAPSINWLPPPEPGTFRGDPFGFSVAGRTWLAFEYCGYATGCGDIQLREHPTSPERLAPIPRTAHQSFPFVFVHDGSTYCMPEAQAGGTTWIRRIDAAECWTRAHAVLPGVPLADATLFDHGGRCWLLAAREDERPFQTLFGWYADSPFGEWTPHPLNPLKTDPESSRPAGTPFVHEGWLYRPAQDCRRTYGGAIVVNHVRDLTPTAFDEEPVRTIFPLPGPYPHGLHTLNPLGDDATLVDGKRQRPRSWASPFVPG